VFAAVTADGKVRVTLLQLKLVKQRSPQNKEPR